MSNLSESIVKAGGELGRAAGVAVALPAALVADAVEGKGGTKAQAILTTAADTGQAIGELVAKEAPRAALMLAMGDMGAAAYIALKVLTGLNGGEGSDFDGDIT